MATHLTGHPNFAKPDALKRATLIGTLAEPTWNRLLAHSTICSLRLPVTSQSIPTSETLNKRKRGAMLYLKKRIACSGWTPFGITTCRYLNGIWYFMGAAHSYSRPPIRFSRKRFFVVT